jgi:hypothetical protein
MNQGNRGDEVRGDDPFAAALAGRGADCLSHAALDRLALGEATADEGVTARAHLQTCARCAATAARLEQDRTNFRETANLSALAADALARAQSAPVAVAPWRRLLPALGVVAVAATAMFVVGPKFQTQVPEEEAPEAAGFARKGGNFGVQVYVLHRETGGTGQLHTGEPLHPGDQIRLQLDSSVPGYAVVLGLDAAGKVSVYHPQGSEAQAIAREPLPQAIELDGTLGTETLVALRCRDRLPVSTAVAAAQTAVRTGAVAAPLQLPCTEVRYVIEKVAP